MKLSASTCRLEGELQRSMLGGAAPAGLKLSSRWCLRRAQLSELFLIGCSCVLEVLEGPGRSSIRSGTVIMDDSALERYFEDSIANVSNNKSLRELPLCVLIN